MQKEKGREREKTVLESQGFKKRDEEKEEAEGREEKWLGSIPGFESLDSLSFFAVFISRAPAGKIFLQDVMQKQKNNE